MKIKNIIKLCAVVILILALATGCWDAKDIEKKDLNIAGAVDIAEDGSLVFYSEIASFSEQNKGIQVGSQNSNKRILLKSKGSTLGKVRANQDRITDRPLYIGEYQCLIFSEKFAYSGIERYMHRLRQLPEYRKTLNIVITPEKLDDIFNSKTENNESVALSIADLLNTLVGSGQCIPSTFGNIMDVLSAPYKGYFVDTIGLLNNKIRFSGYSIFYGSKCIGFIPVEECNGLTNMLAKHPVLVYDIPYKDTLIEIEVRMTKEKTMPHTPKVQSVLILIMLVTPWFCMKKVIFL